MMRRLAVAAVGAWAALLACGRAEEAGARPLAEHFPARTVCYVEARGLAASADALAKTALGKVWHEPEVKEFLSEPIKRLVAQIDGLKARSGFDLRDLESAFLAGACVGAFEMPGKDETAFLLVARMPDDETGPRIMKLLPGLLRQMLAPGMVERATTDADGTLVLRSGRETLSFRLQGRELFWAFTEKGSTLSQVLAVAGEGKLSECKAFAAGEKHLGERPNFVFFLNMKEILAIAAKEMARDREGQMALGIMTLLGLTDIQGVSFSVSADPPGFANRVFIHSPAPRRGILTLPKADPVSDEMLAAVPAGVTGLSAARVDIGGVSKVIREVAAASGVEPAMIDEMMDGFKAQFGFHPEKDIIEQFGDEVALVNLDPASVGGLPIMGLNGLALIVKIKDKRAIGTTMATVAMLGGALAREIPFGGGVIHQTHRGVLVESVQIANLVAPTFAVDGGYLVLAVGPQAAKKVLDTIAGRAPSIGSDETFKAALARLGEQNRCCISFSRSSPGAAGPEVMTAQLGVLSGLLLPALARAREQARRAQCMSNLKQLGLALNMYAQDHNESFPKGLDELVKGGYIADRRLFECPSSPGGGYEYIPGLRTTDPAGTAVIFDSAANHGGDGRNVLHIDGHVRWCDETMAQRKVWSAVGLLKRSGRPAEIKTAAGKAAAVPGGVAAAQPAPAMSFVEMMDKEPERFAKELLDIFRPYKLPSSRSAARHMFAPSGCGMLTDDGFLFKGYGPLPVTNSLGGGVTGMNAGVGTAAVLAAIAVPNLLRSKMAANESSAIACMRTYCGAQNIFHRTDYDGDGLLEYAGPGQQGDAKQHNSFTHLNTTRVQGAKIELLDNAFANARLGAPGARPKAGYYFVDIERDARGQKYNSAFAFGLCAVPAEYNRSGMNTFIVDVQGTVFQRDNGGRPVTQWPDTADPNEPWIVCE